MGLLMKLFGQTFKIRFEGVMEDGQTFSAKTELEVIGMSWEEITEKLKNITYLETGKHVKELKILAAEENG